MKQSTVQYMVNDMLLCCLVSCLVCEKLTFEDASILSLSVVNR